MTVIAQFQHKKTTFSQLILHMNVAIIEQEGLEILF